MCSVAAPTRAMHVRLINAARKGNFNVVKSLIDGVDIGMHNNDALGMASKMGHLEIVKYLVSHGADVNTFDMPPIMYAAAEGHSEVVKFLVEHGADIDAWDGIAIRDASMKGHLEIVKYLIEHGAQVYAGNDDALQNALKNKHFNVVCVLLHVYINTRRYNLWSFMASIFINNQKYVKQHIRYNITPLGCGFTLNINCMVSKLLVRNISVKASILDGLALVPAVYRIIYGGKQGNRACKQGNLARKLSNLARKMHRTYG